MMYSPETTSQQTETVQHRLEYLKQVVLTLLNEVEALGEAQRSKGKRTMKLYDEVRQFERELILHALRQTNGNQTRAARMLGVKVTTLNTKIKRYDIPTEGGPDGMIEMSVQGEALEKHAPA
ncbi:MAG TPA: helix-turn-helix domain-containing protein [Pyrinomonadaceae bacterium]|jgi:transcriptional regulator with GAF, ATPase, and Fis domain|nr:helix-turn-helix domain-containing protein [Pyrinomonadaceae bacterium]